MRESAYSKQRNLSRCEEIRPCEEIYPTLSRDFGVNATSCRHSRSRSHVEHSRNGRVYFAAGISISSSNWGLSSVLPPELQQAALNCSWRFPPPSTCEPCKLLNLLMLKWGRSSVIGRRGSGVQIAPPRPFVSN